MEINLNINKIRNIFKIDKENTIKSLDFIAAIFILITYISLNLFLPSVLNKKIETIPIFGAPFLINVNLGLIIMIIFLLIFSYLSYLLKENKKLKEGIKKQ